MSKELTITLSRVSTVPIVRDVDAGRVQLALERKGYSKLRLLGVEQLGFRRDELRLSVEPDVEFLVGFAQSVESARASGDENPVSIYLDDGILEFTAWFAGNKGWSRVGYLEAVRTTDLPPDKLVGLWRAFVEDLERASE